MSKETYAEEHKDVISLLDALDALRKVHNFYLDKSAYDDSYQIIVGMNGQDAWCELWHEFADNEYIVTAYLYDDAADPAFEQTVTNSPLVALAALLTIMDRQNQPVKL